MPYSGLYTWMSSLTQGVASFAAICQYLCSAVMLNSHGCSTMLACCHCNSCLHLCHLYLTAYSHSMSSDSTCAVNQMRIYSTGTGNSTTGGWRFRQAYQSYQWEFYLTLEQACVLHQLKRLSISSAIWIMCSAGVGKLELISTGLKPGASMYHVIDHAGTRDVIPYGRSQPVFSLVSYSSCCTGTLCTCTSSRWYWAQCQDRFATYLPWVCTRVSCTGQIISLAGV